MPLAPVTLTTRALVVTYGRGTPRSPVVRALAGVDVACRAGEILGILGPNGSGKTTLLRCLAGELAASSGELQVLGCRPDDPALVARVGFQPDGPVPFPQLAAGELLRYLAALMRLPRAAGRRRSEQLLDELELASVAARRVRALSTGMQKRLALAAALLCEPRVLLLDEPTSGLDPFGSRVVLDLLRRRAADGTTILFSSHRLDEVDELSDRVVLLHRGEKVAEGSLDRLLGSGVDALEIEAPSAQLRAALEAMARADGAVVHGWTVRRRHPYALFRELEERAR